MHLAEVVLQAREDGFTHIQIGQGRLPLKTLHRHFSGGGEYLYRFAPEAEFALLTPFGIQVYPLLSQAQEPKGHKHQSAVVRNGTKLSRKQPSLTSAGNAARPRRGEQTPWMFD
jgi:hypothetical protein